MVTYSLRGQKQFYHYSEKHTKNKSKLVIHAMHIELLTEIYNCMQLYDFQSISVTTGIGYEDF